MNSQRHDHASKSIPESAGTDEGREFHTGGFCFERVLDSGAEWLGDGKVSVVPVTRSLERVVGWLC